MIDTRTVTLAEANADSATIPTRSERQAMDWSLVLVSQGILAKIERSDEGRWALVVNLEDYGSALESIRLYRAENRRWRWEQRLPWSESPFHWGSATWSLFITFVFQLDKLALPSLNSAARFDSLAVLNGEWWRFFTAIFLHADLTHLASNATIGFVLLGLAMAGYGAGIGLLAAYLSGALGNLAGLFIYQAPYYGLGASGMVMGALGLISALTFQQWRRRRTIVRPFLRGILAGFLLLVILGLNPASDVVAHIGGFAAGLFFGLVLVNIPEKLLKNPRFQMVNGSVLAALVIWTASSAFSGT
ncbi:MAG: rhomboid family intramembrane serine protease [Verrucomicrobia bacterium]|nr:rhomboid family intramembrane serine protease [Verrucomicrobiota bacterium]